MDKCNKVFVYGTLQMDKGNDRIFHKHEAECFGKAVTQDNFVLGNAGCPYAFPVSVVKDYLEDEELFRPIEGELWSVPSPECLAELDTLEGVASGHYSRHLVLTQEGEEAWMYTQENAMSLNYCYKCSITEEGNWKW